MDSQQKYLFVYAIILLTIFIIYVYISEHKEYIDSDKEWVKSFQENGLNSKEIEAIEHDDDVWYYRGQSTCVAYGDFTDDCDYRISVCSGGEIPYSTHGTRIQQSKNVVEAIRNGGQHKLCPVIYTGAE